MHYKVKYIKIRGQKMFVMVSPNYQTSQNYSLKEYLGAEPSIKRKIIQFYTDIMHGIYNPLRGSNIYEISNWLYAYLKDLDTEQIAVYDAIFHTEYLDRLYHLVADYMITSGVWMDHDYKKTQDKIFLDGLEKRISHLLREIKECLIIAEDRNKKSNLIQMDSYMESSVFPGYFVFRSEQDVYLAPDSCKSDVSSNLINISDERVFCFHDAPQGVYCALAGGLNAHITPEATEYMVKHVVYQVSGIPNQTFLLD